MKLNIFLGFFRERPTRSFKNGKYDVIFKIKGFMKRIKFKFKN
jgi:hypothetical protein